MIELPPMPTFCETEMNFAKSVMEKVIAGEAEQIKINYSAYNGDPDKLILIKAIRSYVSDKPLTPTEFSIKVYEECTGK